MEKEIKTPDWYQVAEVELVYKTKVKASQRPTITSSKDIHELLKGLWNPDKIEMIEEFKVLFLNRGNKVLGVLDVSSGGITGTVADPRIILAAAIKANAVHLIIAHNHPSGALKPSRADELLTTKIKEGALLFDIKLLDHIIMTAESYYSFADEGLL